MTNENILNYFKKLMFVNGKKSAELEKLISLAIPMGTEDFWGSYPWAFKEKHDTITTTASTETVDLGSDFEGLISVIEKTSSKGGKLYKLSPDEYDRLIPDSASNSEGTPKYYKVYYDQEDKVWKLALYPTPSDAISLYVTYQILPIGDDGVPSKYISAQIVAISKYLHLPGSPEWMSANVALQPEINRLQMADSVDYEKISKVLDSSDLDYEIDQYDPLDRF